MIGGRRNREAQMRLTASCRCRTFGGDPAGPDAGQDRKKKYIGYPCCPQLLREADESSVELRQVKILITNVISTENECYCLSPPGLGGPDHRLWWG